MKAGVRIAGLATRCSEPRGTVPLPAPRDAGIVAAKQKSFYGGNMRRLLVTATVATMMTTVVATAAHAQQGIALRDMGSFHVGGKLIEVKGQPIKEVVFTPGGVPAKVDPNGTYQIEQMYAQYFLVQRRKGKLPLLMWHGGGLSGVTWETKPDGKPGWLNYFLKKGWDTYVSDAMERGRASWSPTFGPDPIVLPLGDPWERFRVGPIGSWNNDKAKRATYPGAQFPIASYEQFMKQGIPRWVTTDKQIVAAYIELVDKVCPCVVMVHSQSGTFGYQALEARPDKVKALVAVEPTLGGDVKKIESVKGTPILVVIGDNAKDHPRWKAIRQHSVNYQSAFKTAGGNLDLVDLPDVGIKGNSHMVMMDKNSDQVADLIQKWLLKKGLARN